MMQKAYGKDALLKAQVFGWHKAFREGREDVKNEQHIGPRQRLTLQTMWLW